MVSRSTVPGGGACSAARMMAMAQHHDVAVVTHHANFPCDATPAGTVHVSVGTPSAPLFPFTGAASAHLPSSPHRTSARGGGTGTST